LDDETTRRYADEKEALFRELYTDVRPLDGLIAFLDKLLDLEIPRAIATSAPRANVDFTLAATGMEKYFPTILDDSFVSRGKPDPEIYLKSAAALEIEPGRCVVLEDSLSGVLAGNRAGCKVVGITTTHTRSELGLADCVFDNFVGLDPEKLISALFDQG
jgi:HAD superfamily hydrolase (TIGR01509 family)